MPTAPHPERASRVRPAHWVRAAGNAINLSTGVGLVVALAGRASVRRGPEALLVAEGYRLPLPRAGAFTVGNVVVVPRGLLAGVELRQPGTLAHEAVHAWQYFWCAGLPFLPLYGIASGWSWLRRGDPASGNWFERGAGLVRGGYTERPVTNAGLHRIAAALRPRRA
ncbi:MAG: hypothetical protein QM779_09735 [Propionicimonas sp.]|uniref:hypothetical protein n=1 Tax=Propionicimonas sp. TaxID=1955623 RepID=UPI003D0BFC3E